MATSRITKSSILQGFPKSRSLLAGNAYYIPPSYESIATSTPSGVATITFSSIPSTYSSLQLRFSLTATGTQTLAVQLNGDTTAGNYATHGLSGNGTSAFAFGTINSGKLGVVQYGRTRVDPNVGIFDLVDYASTTKNKTSRSIFGTDNNGVAYGTIEMDSGVWLSTTAVTSLTFLANSGTFTGTIALYGIKG